MSSATTSLPLQKNLLTKRGYVVSKKKLSSEMIQQIKKELTVKPLENHFTSSYVDYSFPIYRETVDHLCLPRYYGLNRFKDQPFDNLLTKNVEKMRPSVSFTGKLRTYQQQPVQQLLTALKTAGGAIFNVQPAFGKTPCAIYIACQLGLKTLIIVPRDFLLTQWKKEIETFTNDSKIDFIQGQNVPSGDSEADFTVATLQSVALKEYDPKTFQGFGLVIIDEIQFLGAKEMSKSFYKTASQYTLGLSATPKREDGLDQIFQWYLGDSVIKVDLLMIRTYKPAVKYIYMTDKVPEVKMVTGDLNMASMINQLTENENRFNLIVYYLTQMLQQPDRKILVLSDRRNYLIRLLDACQQQMPDKKYGLYLGGMTKKQREDINDKIERKELDILLATYQLLSVGVSIEYLNTLFMVTPKPKIEQAVNRIMRKDHLIQPIIFDFVDNHPVFQSQKMKRNAYYQKNGYQVGTKNSEQKNNKSTSNNQVGTKNGEQKNNKQALINLL